MIKLQLFKTPADIADYTFDLLRQVPDGSAALSFGSTYEAIFKRWKELYDAAPGSALPAFFPADERLVDISDQGSNWGSLRRNFLDAYGCDADLSRWASDAAAYRRMLDSFFGATPELPVFSLIFLGIGPDGHTASLFPGDCPDLQDPSWNKAVLETTAPFTPPNRLTLGPEVIASAEHLIVTVTGTGKSDIFKRLMEELDKGGRELLPPSKIIKRREALGYNTEILCDTAAAAKLSDEITAAYRVEK